MRKYPLASNPRIPWTAEEDAAILRAMDTGVRKWSDVAQLLPGRNRKQCRERWYNQINPAIRKGDWTAEEDALLEQLHAVYGNKWSEIAKRVDGRCVLRPVFAPMRRVPVKPQKWTLRVVVFFLAFF